MGAILEISINSIANTATPANVRGLQRKHNEGRQVFVIRPPTCKLLLDIGGKETLQIEEDILQKSEPGILIPEVEEETPKRKD